MYDENTVGPRLRTLRKWRKLSLVQLAGQAGMSKSHLSDIERGRKALDRRSWIAGLANALRVSETEIVGGPHLTQDDVQSAPHAYIPPLRDALESNGVYLHPVVDRARPLDELTALMAGDIEARRREYDYVEVGKLLPDLIDELHFHASEGDEYAQRRAWETLIEAYMCAAGMARTLTYPDLGHMAAMRADEVAVKLGDPITRGKVTFSLIRPNASNWNRVRVMAERAANELEPHVRTPGDLQVLGMLTLNAAMACAATNNHQAAGHWLNEADELARRVPDDMGSNWQAFCTTNVNTWRIAVGVEYGESGALVAGKAGHVDESKLRMHTARRSSFYSDVGRGLARDPKTREEAIKWLKMGETIAPQRFRNDPKVRSTVTVMLERARLDAIGRELRGMAARLGIPH
ncbi:helix-turn-helix transcriptional regulator [Nonomuraea sp. NPDC049158]|uniref:helix-turn-helix domain-containing protein n=1 Tax=Nonomuraea sp. NPDC049158 TaxID=3155649 RepID=UPI0033EE5D0D